MAEASKTTKQANRMGLVNSQQAAVILGFTDDANGVAYLSVLNQLCPYFVPRQKLPGGGGRNFYKKVDLLAWVEVYHPASELNLAQQRRR